MKQRKTPKKSVPLSSPPNPAEPVLNFQRISVRNRNHISSTQFLFCSKRGWTYKFRVILTVACPSNSLTVLQSVPALMHLVTKVWRRTWKLNFSIPFLKRKASKKVRNVLTSTIFSLPLKKTYQDTMVIVPSLRRRATSKWECSCGMSLSSGAKTTASIFPCRTNLSYRTAEEYG